MQGGGIGHGGLPSKSGGKMGVRAAFRKPGRRHTCVFICGQVLRCAAGKLNGSQRKAAE
tara:strand:+ start:1290 stop:1466 length:177 start_codon:yes stop_codon:yes gene_type:complete